MKILKEFDSFEGNKDNQPNKDNQTNESRVVDTAVEKALNFVSKEMDELGTVEAKLAYMSQLQDRIKKYYKEHKM
jgi:hypothetical protein